MTSHLARALELAKRGWGQTAPNPLVGAVVVAGDAVVGEGYHERYGEAHAEVNALRHAGDAARGATLYVSLEPCAHAGKTPPCTDAIIAAGVARVVFPVRDPSTLARGGAEKLRAAGITVDIGDLRDEALELNAPFFNAHATRRPWITLKLALSANGKIADPSGVHRWITGPESRTYVHHLRANADAIAVGIGTVLADDPSLTVRDAVAPRVPLRRVVFDSRGRLPLDSVLARGAREIETIVVARDEQMSADRATGLAAAGVKMIVAPSTERALRALRDVGVRSLFVEGGAGLAGSLVADSLVDRLIIFRSSLVLGNDALDAFGAAPPGFEDSLATARIVERRHFGDDTMTVYSLREVPCSQD